MSGQRTFLALALCLLGLAWAGSAHAQHIGNPNSHVQYGAELEPHFVLQWGYGPPYWGGDGVGVGLRASIPVIPNGPVTSINNSLAVSFGLDWAHFGDDACWGAPTPRVGAPYSCTADDFWVPVVVQWNFFFSDLISAFPELGLAIEHTRFDGGWYRANGNIVYRAGSYSDTSAELVLWLGVRFHLSKSFAITVRIGTPSLTAGASFLL